MSSVYKGKFRVLLPNCYFRVRESDFSNYQPQFQISIVEETHLFEFICILNTMLYYWFRSSMISKYISSILYCACKIK
jgi:hypothetical protein